MRYHEAVPGEPLKWTHTYRYAKELIDEEILNKEEVIFHLSMFRRDQSEEAFNWLVNTASNRHLSLINTREDDDDWPDLVFDQDEQIKEPAKELDEFLEKTYKGPLKKRQKIGYFALRACGNFTVMYTMYRASVRFADEGKLLSSNLAEGIAEATALTLGVLAIRHSLKGI